MLNRCKYHIQESVKIQPSLEYDLSMLTRVAFGDRKGECLEVMSPLDIQLFLRSGEVVDAKDIEDISDVVRSSVGEHGVAEEKQENKNVHNDVDNALDTETGTELFAGVNDIWQEGLGHAQQLGWILLLCVVGYIVRQLLKYLLEFVYDVFNAPRMIFLKVVLPRGDSKSDREVQKELAKDMKEKIGRMSQVYKSMHKLGELGLMEGLLDRVFNKPKFMMALSYDKGLLSFIVGTYPEYQNILEGAISAQYAEVSLEQIPSPDFYTKKHHDILAIEPAKEPIYPMRIFKQLEDDPLNNLIDAIAKVPTEDS